MAFFDWLFTKFVTDGVFWLFDRTGLGERVSWFSRRPALRLVFSEGERSPFFFSQLCVSERKPSSAIRRVFCVGVQNMGRTPAPARVVVEKIQTPDEDRPGRALQVFDAGQGVDTRMVEPDRKGPTAFFELAEEFVPHSGGDTDHAFICYAQPVNERFASLGKTLVTLRVEGGGSKKDRMRLVIQKRQPGGPFREPVKTALEVRRFRP